MKKHPLYETYVKGKPKPKSIKDTLRRVREILSVRGNWRKGALYGVSKGFEYSSKNSRREQAISCCLWGALKLVDGRYKGRAEGRLCKVLDKNPAENLAGYNITTFNDNSKTTHAKLLKVLDEAIGD